MQYDIASKSKGGGGGGTLLAKSNYNLHQLYLLSDNISSKGTVYPANM